MLRYFHKITSLNNLRRNQRKSASKKSAQISVEKICDNLRRGRGQIATLLTLIMVIILVLILIVVNTGDYALKATRLSNAADAGALLLASQLSTIAKQKFEANDNEIRHCVKGGLLGAFLAFLTAVAAVVITIATGGAGAWTLTLIGTVAGAVGGAVGQMAVHGVSWKNLGIGLALGAAIGFSVGATAGSFVPVPGGETGGAATAGAEVAGEAAAVAKEVGTLGKIFKGLKAVYNAVKGAYTATNNFINGLVEKATNFVGNIMNKIGLGALRSGASKLWAAKLPGLTGMPGMTIGEALSIGGTGYGILDKMNDFQKSMAKSMDAFYDSINSLSDREAYREGAFLTVLSQTVEDLNTTIDVNDSDGDGDYQESVPYFQYWWDERIRLLKGAVAQMSQAIISFWEGDMQDFRDFVNNWGIPYLSREEVEGGDDWNPINDGPVVELCRGVEGHPDKYGNLIDVNFWDPLPNRGDYDTIGDECDIGWDCDAPLTCDGQDLDGACYDEVDFTIDNFKDFRETVESFAQQGYQNLASTWSSWITWFYQDPNAPGYIEEDDNSFYKVFSLILNGEDPNDPEFIKLSEWQDEIDRIENILPDCIYDPPNNPNGLITNYPCKSPSYVYPSYSTIDGDDDDDDEFDVARQDIQNIIINLSDITTDLRNWYNNVEGIIINIPPEFGGTDPVTYKWTDSQGEHSIRVDAGPFKVPYIEKGKRTGNWLSNKRCYTLRDYQDQNGTNTWIEVTRKDPPGAQVGILGFWKTGTISRKSSAYFTMDNSGNQTLGIRRIKW